MVSEIKRVLFATDLSGNARQAFQYAASMAARWNAGIIVLHVLDTDFESKKLVEAALGEKAWRAFQEQHQQQARSVLIGKRGDFHIVQQALADLYFDPRALNEELTFEPLDLLVSEGNAVDEILSTAAERACDLIVIGAHKSFFGKTTVGTVAKGVIARSPVPVLVIPPKKSA